MSQRIQLLPEHIIDQIKAGEVIERPSTLLKELLENSVDAGASQIDIEIAQNGLDLLSVADNGKGIPFDELDLAFCRHATSKIERFEDIYNLFTYGFRGEALASIAAVSKLTCVSHPAGQPEGMIKINGGETVTLDRDSSPEKSGGTKMFIRDLFYNTPARMKFIQSKTSEKNQLDKIVKAFLLTQPEIKFTVKWDDQDKAVYPARSPEDLKERVTDAIKKNRPLNLWELNSSYDGIHFKIYLSHESTRGNAGKSQFIFVNDRLVQDVQIHKVILNSAQNMWPLGETGHYCAYLELPAERVDVNIHPNKTQVKFYEAGKVFSLISGAIKDGLSKRRREVSPDAAQDDLNIPEAAGNLSEKPMEYRQYEFDSGNSSLQNYFDRLDHGKPSKLTEESAVKMLAHFGELALVQVEEKLFALKTAELMAARLSQIFQTGDKTPTPLLVSQPLSLERPITFEETSKLGELGFEIDQIAPGDFVLRTFPNCLKNFPFRDYLERLLNTSTKIEGARSFEKIKLKDQTQWSHHHKKAVEELGVSYLVENEIASELTKEKLKKLL